MSDIQPNDDGTCSLGGCDACQHVIPGGTYDSDSCVCSLVWNRFVFCFEICPVAHGRLRARVEELQAPIMEVAKVVPGESRIETACRIIREHENRYVGSSANTKTGVLVQPRSPTMSDIQSMEGE